MKRYKPKVFIIGATGYTGQHLVRTLCQQNTPTVAHVRPDSPRAEACCERFSSWGARVDRTPFTVAALASTFASDPPSHIYCLLGTTRRRSRESGGHETYQSVDVALTETALEAAKLGAASAHLIYLSAIGAGRTTSAYLRARTSAEALIRQSGLAYTVVRPSFISGSDRDERRVGERLGAIVTSSALNLVGALGARRFAARYRPRSGAELALGLATIAKSSTFCNKTIFADALDPT
ncbi:MAG: NAD(P)H-binding protein [Deltaproteobacteria bacterium]|nr:NAD(P)H-binding protein [Deltaproteobacteria bacterium]